MESSILNTTKKILNLSENFTKFDLDIVVHINSVFATLDQIGIGPAGGYYIEDASADWSELNLPGNQLHMVKTYLFLKVKSLFDPPTTSFHIEAMNKQIEQLEWRLRVSSDALLPPAEPVVEEEPV